ncbi:hypothetical protein CCM_07869 [Cordyceps militaris CM01]|uniref:Uncharacterized protein n=1 Tax=Cordyceps militaris (strain CM01) TaxID=983644 RepID=G3JP07_CORMM|nr:uncharacterized protein CCM_07869 [Cordyceps militaris CM01]EGX89617.1 hypothetical protein CCM_07869 [Cordyceps militaris CM01]
MHVTVAFGGCASQRDALSAWATAAHRKSLSVKEEPAGDLGPSSPSPVVVVPPRRFWLNSQATSHSTNFGLPVAREFCAVGLKDIEIGFLGPAAEKRPECEANGQSRSSGKRRRSSLSWSNKAGSGTRARVGCQEQGTSFVPTSVADQHGHLPIR